MRLARELAVAIEAVSTASIVARRIQQTLDLTDVRSKPDKSPVTVADFASQAITSYFLSQCSATKNDVIIGEEESSGLRSDPVLASRVLEVIRHGMVHVPEAINLSSDQWLDLIDRASSAKSLVTSPRRYWTLDPVDGTKGFLRRQQFAVCLAFLEDDEVQLGVLGCPNLPLAQSGLLLWAVRGQGSYQVDLSIPPGDAITCSTRISAESDPTSIKLLESYESSHTNHELSASMANRLGVTSPPLRMDSQCKYAEVARGSGHVYLRILRDVHYKERIWDHAAGSLIVIEAGGKVTDLLGNPIKYSYSSVLSQNVGILATSGSMMFHQHVLDVIQSDPGFAPYAEASKAALSNM